MGNDNRDWLANLPPYPERIPQRRPDEVQSAPTAAIPAAPQSASQPVGPVPQPSVAAPAWTGGDPVHPANTWGAAAVNEPVRKRSARKAATIVGVAAAVLVGGGVAACAAANSPAEAAATSQAAGIGQDSGTDAGADSGADSGGGPGAQGGTGTGGGEDPGGPGQGGAGQDGMMGQGGPRDGGMMPGGSGMLGGASLHGEYVVADEDGTYVTMATQTGEVTAVSDASITLTSEDGFSRTYALGGDTAVRGLSRGSTASAEVEAGSTVTVVATKSGGAYEATTLLVSRTASGGSSGSSPDSGSSSGASGDSSSPSSHDAAEGAGETDANGSAASAAVGTSA